MPKLRRQPYNFGGYVGCVDRFVSRDTKTLVGLYHAVQAGFESDRDARWMAVCEVHHCCVGHRTLAEARRSRDPRQWCEDCRTPPVDTSDPAG